VPLDGRACGWVVTPENATWAAPGAAALLQRQWPRGDTAAAERERSIAACAEADVDLVVTIPAAGPGDVLGCESDNALQTVGYARVSRATDPAGVPCALVLSVVTAPQVRGRGVGRFAMALAEDLARSRLGVEQVYLSVAADGPAAFYAGLGYESGPEVQAVTRVPAAVANRGGTQGLAGLLARRVAAAAAASASASATASATATGGGGGGGGDTGTAQDKATKRWFRKSVGWDTLFEVSMD
jgi:ribosomal protein S18 acetylase RimI-like enzyme